MSGTAQIEKFKIPDEVNFITQGKGAPVVMIHGLAASLHDWDFLLPELAGVGYAGYALDLLGHGDSPKPERRDYQVDWLIDHFLAWFETLNLKQTPVLIGHSLGGYIALEFARRFPGRTLGLILVDPFYSLSQLPPFMRFVYRHPSVNGFIVHGTPEWLLRLVIDVSSISMGHSAGGLHALPEEVRARTTLDYTRTAPGVYNILSGELDLTAGLASIITPSLVVWGDRDQTLAPASFAKLVTVLPNATGRSILAGHVPHQSEAVWFNGLVMEFLASLCQ